MVEDLRKQRLRELERKGATSHEPALTADRSAHAKCEICGSVELDFQIQRVFGVAVCPKDKQEHPERYSLLTKTECKEDYLLTDRPFHRIVDRRDFPDVMCSGAQGRRPPATFAGTGRPLAVSIAVLTLEQRPNPHR
jgi:hypothetical protein